MKFRNVGNGRYVRQFSSPYMYGHESMLRDILFWIGMFVCFFVWWM